MTETDRSGGNGHNVAAASTALVNGGLWGAEAADWAAIQEGTCLPVYRACFRRLAPPAPFRLLDVGCGAGLAAQVAADEHAARVDGVDATEELLAIARTRVPAGAFAQGAMELLPYPASTFDLVTGFNAFQYAADPVGALAEARRVARPGATVVVMTWGPPAGMGAAAVVGALRPLLPVPPAGAPGPFALSDEAALRGFAEQAGLVPFDIFDVASPWEYADLDTALRGLRSSGVARRAVVQSGAEAVDEAHARALSPFRQSDGRYRVDALFRCLAARA